MTDYIVWVCGCVWNVSVKLSVAWLCLCLFCNVASCTIAILCVCVVNVQFHILSIFIGYFCQVTLDDKSFRSPFMWESCPY